MPPDIPVVELLRVSTADQAGDDRAGLPRQMEANRRTRERHGLHVVRRYELVDVSGASINHVPEIADMLDMLRSGQARGILAADFDRLLRPDDFRSLGILQDIREAGALIYLPDQILDLNTQAGYLVSGINSIIAGNELAQIKKRMLGAKEEKRRQGKCPGNSLTLPLGVAYDRAVERYRYTEDAERVRELFTLFLGGIHNYVELERRTGIQHRTVMNLLRNELYIGYRHYKEKRSSERRVRPDGRRADRRKVVRPAAEDIRVKVIEEPLIQEEDFWRAQDIIAGKRGDYTARRKAGQSTFLFQGLLRCGVCGEPMYTVPGGKAGPQKDYYYCRRKASHFRAKGVEPCTSGYLRRSVVEDIVQRFIADRLADPDYILEQLSRQREEGQGRAEQVEHEMLEKRIEAAEKKRRKILDLYLKDVFPEEELDAKVASLASEIRTLQSRLEGLGESKRAIATPQDLENIARAVAEAFALFPLWDEDDQRKFLELQRPTFWLSSEGVTKFALPVHKNGNRMGRGSWPPRA